MQKCCTKGCGRNSGGGQKEGSGEKRHLFGVGIIWSEEFRVWGRREISGQVYGKWSTCESHLKVDLDVR